MIFFYSIRYQKLLQDVELTGPTSTTAATQEEINFFKTTTSSSSSSPSPPDDDGSNDDGEEEKKRVNTNNNNNNNNKMGNKKPIHTFQKHIMTQRQPKAKSHTGPTIQVEPSMENDDEHHNTKSPTSANEAEEEGGQQQRQLVTHRYVLVQDGLRSAGGDYFVRIDGCVNTETHVCNPTFYNIEVEYGIGEDFVCDQPCKNGGKCIATNKCFCVNGWSGPTCETGNLLKKKPTHANRVYVCCVCV